MVTSTDLEIGARVMSADGKALGSVKEIATDRFRVERRLLWDYWLANEYVDNAAGGVVQLILTKQGISAAKIEPPR